VWIRKLQDLGDSSAITVPRDVARVWRARRVRYVEVEWRGDELVIRPLTDDELMRRPAPEEEVSLPRGPSDAKS